MMTQPPFSFVLLFLFFSLIFLTNTFKLWFRTDAYYQELINSLERYPASFRNIFLKRLENRKRWEIGQKIFSIIGLVAVIGADVFVVLAYLG